MKNKKTALLLAVCLSLGTLAGCSTEEINNYRQAELDLADGNFQTALAVSYTHLTLPTNREV